MNTRTFVFGDPEPGQEVPVLDLTGPPPVLDLRPSTPVDPPGVDVPLPFEEQE